MATLLWQIAPELEQFRRQIDELWEVRWADHPLRHSTVSSSRPQGRSVSAQPAGQNAAQSASQPAPWQPAIAVQETDASYQIQVQIPGIDAKTLDLEASRDRITIRGDRPAPQRSAPEAGAQAIAEETAEAKVRPTLIHSEFRYGPFERSFRLAEEIQPQAVRASYDQGILTLTLPKRRAAADYRVKLQLPTQRTEAMPTELSQTETATDLDPVW